MCRLQRAGLPARGVGALRPQDGVHAGAGGGQGGHPVHRLAARAGAGGQVRGRLRPQGGKVRHKPTGNVSLQFKYYLCEFLENRFF